MPAAPGDDSSPESPPSIYNRVFWTSFTANAVAVAANSLTFQFGVYIKQLGGTDQISGTIVAVGTIAAVVSRLKLGQALDRHGPRKIWLGSTVLFLTGLVWFLCWPELSWGLYAARVLFSVGLAGMFSSSMVHIQGQVPADRRTEVIASLGASGFLGMNFGTFVSDVVQKTAWIPPEQRYLAMFGGALVLGLVYVGLVLSVTGGERHVAPSETPAAHHLIFRHWPGPIVLVAMMLGINFAVISIFLARFANERGLGGINNFFIGYTLAAFAFRLVTRHWGNSVGRHRMALLGLLALGVGQWMFPFIHTGWHLVFPAVVNGFGHALLFPAVVSVGAGKFPIRFRGTGTTIVLGFTEIGTIVSAPLLGGIIDYFDHKGFVPMFIVTGGTSFLFAAYYLLTAARQPDCDYIEPADDSVVRLPGFVAHAPTPVAAAATLAASVAEPVPIPIPSEETSREPAGGRSPRHTFREAASPES